MKVTVVPHKPSVREHAKHGYAVVCSCGWREFAYNRKFALEKALYHMESLVSRAA